MEVRIDFTDSELISIQKCAFEEGVDVSAFIRGAALELVRDIEDFKIFKEDMLIHWDDTAENIYNHVRGLSPYPAAFTHIGFRAQESDEWKPCILKIFDVEITSFSSTLKPGTIIIDSANKMRICTQNFDISVKILQIEGKKRMPIEVFLTGFRNKNYTNFLF